MEQAQKTAQQTVEYSRANLDSGCKFEEQKILAWDKEPLSEDTTYRFILLHCPLAWCVYLVKRIGMTQGNGTPLQYSCLENPMDGGAWWAAVRGVAESRTRLSDFTFTFHFHTLKKEMATHSSILAWRIPGMGEPGGLPSMGSHRVGHDWSDFVAAAAATPVRLNEVVPKLLWEI